jgi:hypothetical protein
MRNNRLRALAVLAWLLPLAAPVGEWTKRAGRPSADKPSAAFSPDGRNLALLDGKGTLTIWDPATGKQRKTTTLALGCCRSTPIRLKSNGMSLSIDRATMHLALFARSLTWLTFSDSS